MEKKTKKRGIGFERRDILKFMTTMPAAALVSMAPFASEVANATPQQPAARNASAEYQPKVFNPHEWRTLRILSDLILPADQRSGSATQVGVPEFIDDWLNVKQGNLLDEIRGGLTWLDMVANRSFKYDFLDCSTARQEKILDRIAYPEKATPEDASAVAFFNTLRDLVISGFFTSRMGVRDLPYIGNQPQKKWTGCPPNVLARLGLSGGKSEA